MSKTTKSKSYPAPASHVAKEVKAGGHVLLWVGVAIAAVMLAGPHFGEWFSNQTANAGVNTAKGVLKGTAEAAEGVCSPGQLNYICGVAAGASGAKPDNGQYWSNRANAPTGTTPDPPAAPAPPKPQPYGPANGPVKPLPSVTPAAPKPEIGPADPPPVLEGGGGGLGPLGELLAKIPEVGPAIEGGLKAIGPAASAAAKP